VVTNNKERYKQGDGKSDLCFGEIAHKMRLDASIVSNMSNGTRAALIYISDSDTGFSRRARRPVWHATRNPWCSGN
jgi:hypothetical protein